MSNYRKTKGKQVYQKKSWQSVLTRAANTVSFPNGVESVNTIIVASNSAGSSIPTPTILKVKNIKINLTLTSSVDNASSNIQAGVCSVSFIPEGYVASPLTISQHPEWLMGWKSFRLRDYGDSGARADLAQISFSSRLARNLKSGDSIAVLIQAYNTWNEAIPLTLAHTVSSPQFL